MSEKEIRQVKLKIILAMLNEDAKLRKQVKWLIQKMNFETFIALCGDADKLLDSLNHNPRLQGKKPRTLKASALHYLARKRHLRLTLNHLFFIYGCMQGTIIRIEKIIRKTLEPQSLFFCRRVIIIFTYHENVCRYAVCQLKVCK